MIIRKYIFLLLPLLFALLGPYTLSDLGIWVEWGKQIITQGTIWTTETRSILPTTPPVFQSWSLSLIYLGLMKVSGIYGLIYFHHALIVLIFYLIYRASLFKSSDLVFGHERFFIYLAFIGILPSLIERPSLVALVPLLLSIELLRHDELKNKDYISLLLINIVWTNIHSSSFLLLVFMGWRILTRLILKKGLKKELHFSILLALTTLINPFGFSIYSHAWQTMIFSKQRGISEWDSLYAINYIPILIELLILVGTLIFLWMKKRSLFIRYVHHPFIPLLMGSFLALRNSSLPFVALLPYLSCVGYFQGDKLETRKTNLIPAAILLTALGVFLTPSLKYFLFPILPKGRQYIFDDHTLLRTSSWIKDSKLSCPLFSNWNYTSSLLITTSNPTFIDGRNTIFTKKDFLEYSNFMKGNGVKSYLDKYHPCLFILNAQTDHDLIKILKNNFHASVIVEEKDAVLLKL